MDQQGLSILLLTASMLLSSVQPSGVIKRYHYIKEPMTWLQAQSYCREKFTDLATIEDEACGAEARQVTGTGKKVWIGLNSHWKWSAGDVIDLQDWYNTWAKKEPSHNRCVVMEGSGLWFTKDCEDRYQFFCNRAPRRNDHVESRKGNENQDQDPALMLQILPWAIAQAYCRRYYVDLSSVKTHTENQQLRQLLFHGPEGGTSDDTASAAWLGLYRTQWAWSDGSNATYRRWGEVQEHEVAECAMMETTSSEWVRHPCGYTCSVLCQSVGRSSVAVKLQLSSSADLSDATMQESILKQVRQKLTEGVVPEGATIRWSKLPHKEEEEEQEEQEEKEKCDPLYG